jgi:hypothetical protein
VDPASVEEEEEEEECETCNAPCAATGSSATANMRGRMYALPTKWWKLKEVLV